MRTLLRGSRRNDSSLCRLWLDKFPDSLSEGQIGQGLPGGAHLSAQHWDDACAVRPLPGPDAGQAHVRTQLVLPEQESQIAAGVEHKALVDGVAAVAGDLEMRAGPSEVRLEVPTSQLPAGRVPDHRVIILMDVAVAHSQRPGGPEV